jgi:hypothetical protein
VVEGAVEDQATVNDVLDHPAPVGDEAKTKVSDEPFMFEDVAEELLKPNPLEQGREDRDVLELFVEVDGSDVQVSELVKGYMRQSDYTKKTQALAEERKTFTAESEAASKLMSALRDNPAGTIAGLAVSVGLIAESDLDANVVGTINRDYKVPNREDVASQVEARAKALLETDPRVQAAEDAELMRQIEGQFMQIEQDEGVSFSQRDKEAILQRAVDMQTTRVDLAYLDLKSKAERLRSERKSAQQSAPQAPTAGRVEHDSTNTQPSTPATSVLEAWSRAKATLSA